MTRAIRRLAAAVAVLALPACGAPETKAPPAAADDTPGAVTGLPAAFSARLDAAGLDYAVLDGHGQALGLARAATDSGAVLLLYADLARGARVAQVLGTPDTTDAQPGLYHPTALSPHLRLIPPPAGGVPFWVSNGAFFETPGRPASELAFPIVTGRRVVTGGRSPYGPGRPGADARRWGAPLRAFGFGQDSVAVVPYDPETGAPLGVGDFAEAVVSYAPDAHPTRIATRFHVLGPLGADTTGRSQTLLWAVTDGGSTIDAPATLLARLGVQRERQIALDGGASVSVTSARAGQLERSAGDQPLPHWLIVRSE